MPDVFAVSSSPTSAVPVIAGAPVALVVSSSVTVMLRDAVTDVYSAAPTARWVSRAESLSTSPSSPAATVTVCVLSQVDGVKVSIAVAGVRVRSVPAWPVIVTVTSAVGSEFSATV